MIISSLSSGDGKKIYQMYINTISNFFDIELMAFQTLSQGLEMNQVPSEYVLFNFMLFCNINFIGCFVQQF